MSTNFDDILDSSIDDLADLPEFELFPSGVYKVRIEFERKEINKSPYVEMKMALVETLELASPETDVAPKDGTEASCLFKLDNEFGQGNLKKILKPLAEHHGVSKLSEAMAESKGMEVDVVVVRKADKKGVLRMNVSKLMI